jgi:hypothetical protein
MTPHQLQEAVVLRAAGLSLVGIAGQVGVSVSTLQRAFKHHRTKKGEAKAELVAAAKQEMLGRVTSDECIRQEAARLIADDIAHTVMLREKMALAAEQLTATNLHEAVLLMRACAAYSTALKNTSDTIRHVLPQPAAVDQAEDLPELVITVISNEHAVLMATNARRGMEPFDEPEPAGDESDDAVVNESRPTLAG